MRTASLLDLARRLVSEPPHNETETHVIPVLIDRLSPVESDLLKACAGCLEGVLVNAADLADGTVGFIDDALKAALEAGFMVPGPAGTDFGVDILETKPEFVEVHLRGVRYTANTGHRIILGLLTSLFSKQLREAPFAMVCYDEAELEPELKDVAFRLFSDHIGRRQLGACRTLIAVVEALETSIPRHVSRGAAFQRNTMRHFLRGDLLSTRKEWGLSLAIARRVAAHPGLLVLFLAAGFSASSGMPLGNALRDEAIEGLCAPEATDNKAAAFRRYLQQNHRPAYEHEDDALFSARLTMERVLREVYRQYGDPSDVPAVKSLTRFEAGALASRGPSVYAVGELVHRRSGPTVLLTVNFDRLVESVLGGDVEVFADPLEFGHADGYVAEYLAHPTTSAVPLIKVHGSLDRPGTLVATADQTEVGLPHDLVSLFQRLAARGREVMWVWIGSSMRDYDVSVEVEDRQYAFTEELWVAPELDAHVQTFMRDHRSAQWRNDPGRRSEPEEHVVTETADDFMRAVVEALPAAPAPSP